MISQYTETATRDPSVESAIDNCGCFHVLCTMGGLLLTPDQPTLWVEKGTTVMRPKSKGAGIMVSDFIDEHSGYLQLTDEEHAHAKENDPVGAGLW